MKPNQRNKISFSKSVINFVVSFQKKIDFNRPIQGAIKANKQNKSNLDEIRKVGLRRERSNGWFKGLSVNDVTRV